MHQPHYPSDTSDITKIMSIIQQYIIPSLPQSDMRRQICLNINIREISENVIVQHVMDDCYWLQSNNSSILGWIMNGICIKGVWRFLILDIWVPIKLKNTTAGTIPTQSASTLIMLVQTSRASYSLYHQARMGDHIIATSRMSLW